MTVKEITVKVPEYLYEESVRMMTLGLFRDLSDLVSAGLRRELQEARQMIIAEPEDWYEGLARLRSQIKERKAKYGDDKRSEEETLADLRAIRQEIWENEYRPRYTFGS